MRRKLKVAYAYTGFYRGGGGEMHSLLLAKHINRTKFDLSVCVIENSRSPLRLEIEKSGCPVYDLNLSRQLHTGVNAMRIVKRFYGLFKRLTPDIVQTQALHTNLCARLAAILAGVPIIVSTENSLRDIERRVLHRVANKPFYLASDLLDRRSQSICVVSEFIRRKKDPKGKSSKIVVLPAFFDVESYCGWDERILRQPFADLERPVIGIVGRLSPEKGHADLIAAMPAIMKVAPGATLLVVGAGPEEHELKRRVERLGIQRNVQFVGYRRDVYPFLARMDTLCVPSLSEGLSIVAVEGMAMGLPVIAARVGGLPELVADHETGILIKAGDAAAVVAAVKFLLEHPAEARRFGRAARVRALSQFRPERFVGRHEELYEMLAGRHLQA